MDKGTDMDKGYLTTNLTKDGSKDKTLQGSFYIFLFSENKMLSETRYN